MIFYLGSVFLDSLDISLKSFNRSVSSLHINRDTALTGFTDSPSGGLDFSWGETFASSDTHVVSLSWAMDSWAEKSTSWARSSSSVLQKSIMIRWPIRKEYFTFATLFADLLAFLAGWLNQVLTLLFQSLWKWALAKMLFLFPTMFSRF